MKTLEESVVQAMDGSNIELYKYLPYILQDLWEIGSSPKIIIEMIKKHTKNYELLQVFDLGCGKGAVSIQLAKELKCKCIGIDAIKEFITEANNKAMEYNVKKLCKFKVGDIRIEIKQIENFDVIILGSIGPVLGNIFETLIKIKKCIKEDGLIILDDGYIDDNSKYKDPVIQKKEEIMKQIDNAEMELIDETIISNNEIKESDEWIFEKIKNRCNELLEKHPDKKEIFLQYIRDQERENEILENKIVCSTMIIKTKLMKK